MSSATDNHYAPSAMAGPGNFEQPPEAASSKSSVVTALIYSTAKYPGLGLGLPRSTNVNARKLRATAGIFAPGSNNPQQLQEVDETTDTSGSDSEAETLSGSATSSSVSSFERFPLRHNRLVYRHRLRPYRSESSNTTIVGTDDDRGEDAPTPGAPRISFPPTPPLGRESLQELASDVTNLERRREGTEVRSGTPKKATDTGIFFESWAPTTEEQSQPTFDPFRVDMATCDEEAAHYYLPMNLLSPELEMSSGEFVATVRGWTQRRHAVCMGMGRLL
ncbi:hypothetical protein BC835DRAFT_1410527 [Cytidiella melzeri]|nr:hypothetical protein BC835DRAFT_1410527 [Cytidiella melzeri]